MQKAYYNVMLTKRCIHFPVSSSLYMDSSHWVIVLSQGLLSDIYTWTVDSGIQEATLSAYENINFLVQEILQPRENNYKCINDG